MAYFGFSKFRSMITWLTNRVLTCSTSLVQSLIVAGRITRSLYNKALNRSGLSVAVGLSPDGRRLPLYPTPVSLIHISWSARLTQALSCLAKRRSWRAARGFRPADELIAQTQARPSYDVWDAVVKVLSGPLGKLDATESFLGCRDWNAYCQTVQTGANG